MTVTPSPQSVIAELLEHSVTRYGHPKDETCGVGLLHAQARAFLAAPAPSSLAGGEVTDEWADRFCEAVNWSPDGQECKTVEGELRCTTFRQIAKGHILSAIATNPYPDNSALSPEAPAREGDVAWACTACNSPRAVDPCPKCGTELTKPADGWDWPRLPDIERIRELAREVGYAVGVHGTLERDLDLIAAPWIAEAVTPFELAQHIASALGGNVLDYKTQDKPCGRWSCNINSDGWFKLIDLSVMTPALTPRHEAPASECDDCGSPLNSDGECIRDLDEREADDRHEAPAEPVSDRYRFDDEIAWLREAARYFSFRDTKGEDRAHWANVYNAENAVKLADRLAELSSNPCQLEPLTPRHEAPAELLSNPQELAPAEDPVPSEWTGQGTDADFFKPAKTAFSKEAPAEGLTMADERPAFQVINDLFAKHGLESPPWKLRDDLATHLMSHRRQPEAPAEPCKSCNGTGRELGSAFNRCADCEAPAEGAGSWMQRLADVQIGRDVDQVYFDFPHRDATFLGDLGRALIDLRARSSAPEAREGEAPVRGEIRIVNGKRCRFIERELEGDKWEVIGPAHPAAPSADRLRFSPTHRHLGRGSTYEVIGEARLQQSGQFGPVEGDSITVYRGEDGQLWCRAQSEFEDGRFVSLSTPDALKGDA